MPFVLTNTLTSEKERFVAADPNHTRVYVCGPTPYDHAHLGHIRCYVIYDILVRHLRASGQNVTYVRNYTDIDDKILARSQQRGVTPQELSEEYIQCFRQDMEAVGNLPPDREPKVTEHVPQVIRLIERLIERGAAYPSHGDVYFRVRAFPEYGKLSHRNVDSMREGASGRVEENEQRKKEDAVDFALWKGTPEGGWGWPSPWGFGRPGWHIECSAMALEYLGETVDLHGGGLDLVFPHHENEIAQSEAASGKCFCPHWMHNGFVEVNREKMAKSLGNFFTARALFALHEPEAIRLAFLPIHYRSPFNFEWVDGQDGKPASFPMFDDAERRLEYIYMTRQRLESVDPTRINDTGETDDSIRNYPRNLKVALNDDLNTATAMAVTSEFLKQVNELVDQSKRKKGLVAAEALQLAKEGFDELSLRLGIGAQNVEEVLGRIRDRRAKNLGIDGGAVDAKLVARRQAREDRDFARADALRDELIQMGVELMDSPQGTTWRIP